MRNSENSSTRSKFAALTRIGLLVLIFAVVFATVLSCGAFGESATLNNGSVENVAEAVDADAVAAGGSAGAVSVGGWPSYRSVKEGIYNNGHHDFTISLTGVSFANSYSYITYDAGGWLPGGVGAKALYANNQVNSFGGMASESSSTVTYDVIAATNIAIGSDIISLLATNAYDVSVKWGVVNLFYWDNANSCTYMGLWGNTTAVGFSSGTTSQPIPIDNWGNSGWQSVGALNSSNRDGTIPTSNGDAHNKKNQSQDSYVSLSSNASYLTLAVGRDSSGSRATYGVGVSGITLSFRISIKSGATESTEPKIEADTVSLEGDGEDATFSGLTIPSDSVFHGAYVTQQGSYDPASYTLNTVTSEYYGDRSGFYYYKSFAFTASDGTLNQAAYGSGIKQITLTKGESITAEPGESKNNGTKFRLEVGSLSEGGLQAEVRAYFAESGTYTFKITDNCDNSSSFTVTIGGIDLRDPTATGSISDSFATSLSDLDSKQWTDHCAEVATINGMPTGVNLSAGDSAWAYYYDISYSFFKPTSAPSSLSEGMKTKIKNGEFYPFAFTSSAYPVYFSYNTETGAVRYGIGDSKTTSTSATHSEKVKPLSGEKVYDVAGYYTIMIYVADMGGNVQAQPFVYYLKVDSSTVSASAPSYTYGEGKTPADGWINSYMLGEDEEVYVDITFKLNPSGNIITFNYDGNYYGSVPIADSYNFTATVTPVSGTAAPTVEVTDGKNVNVTLSGTELAELVSGTTTLAEKSVPRAVLKAQIGTPSGSGADWTVTLTLVYSRGSADGAVGEFNINNANTIGVASVYGGTPSKTETVNVKVDTQAIADITFDDAGNYVFEGDYSLENGGIKINTDSVAGRTWYTTDSELGLISSTNASFINEYQLTQLSEYKNYATYFGWKIYTDGSTVDGAIAADLARFKKDVEGAGTGMAGAFETFFGADEGENLWQVNQPSEQGNLLSASTGVFVQNGRAGVRVLYIMTLDQAGNANFAIYYLFVDPTTYQMSFDIPADYLEKFPALNGITFTVTDFETGEELTTFKRGTNVSVTVNGVPGGYLPYTIRKFIGTAETTFYRSTGTSSSYDEAYWVGGITTPGTGDFVGENTIAFVLDQASNLGSVTTEEGQGIGLRFTFRMYVSITPVATGIEYNGYALTKKSNDYLNVTSTATGFQASDIASVREAAYAMLTWEGAGLSEGLPINVDTYTPVGKISFVGENEQGDNKFYMSNSVYDFSVTISKRTLSIDGIAGEWADSIYGAVKKGAFGALSDDTLGAKTLAEILGVADADLGQDSGKTLAGILTGSGYVLVNSNALGSEEYDNLFSAVGNLNAGEYALSFNSACTAANYNVTLGKSFNVAKKTLSVTASGSKVYGNADGNIIVSFGDSANLCGDDITAVFPKLGAAGSTGVYLPAGTSAARNYVYDNQGTDNYTDVGTYNITSVIIPSANLSANFAIKFASGTFEVTQLTVYVAPDEGQKIYSPTDYDIAFSYYYTEPSSGSAQEVIEPRILDQIVEGSFRTVGVPQPSDPDMIYDIEIANQFSASTGNVKVKDYIGGRTVELVYNWDTGTFTISVKNGVTLSAVYGDLFDERKLLDSDNFTITYDDKSPISGEWVLTWTAASLSGYDTSDVLANGVKSYAITIANDAFQLTIDGVPQTDLSSKYNFNVVASASVTQLEIKITPSFETTEKTYGDPDAFVPTFTAANVNGSASNAFVFDAGKLSGNMVRALFGSDGKYVRVGAVNDPVTAPNGGYYGAYVTQSYAYDSNVKVTMDNEALNAIRFTVKAREIRLSNTPENSDVTAFGKNKEVPTGTADVNYAAREPFTISNLVAGDDVYIAYTTALYVKKDDSAFTDGELNGTAGDVTDLNIEIAGLSLAGDAAANYVLVVDGGGLVADFVFVIVSENENEFIIYAYQFSGIKASDVAIVKVYDGTRALADEDYSISGELKKVQDQFSTAFDILGVRYGSFVYRQELTSANHGYISGIDVAFFVEGLSPVSFKDTSPETFQVADYTTDDGRQGVVIVVWQTSATINQRPLSLDEVTFKPDYAERYYNGTNVVTVTITWAEGADSSLFTPAELRNLNMRANFTLDGKDAATYTGINVASLNYNASSNFAPTFNADDIAGLFAAAETVVKPVPLNVTFAFVAQEYGFATTTLDGENYRKYITSDYVYAGAGGWDAELDSISIKTSGATFTYSDADGNAYPYVQYDANGRVRLHDIAYAGVTFGAANGVNLVNYTFQGSALTASSSGVIEAVAELTPKPLVFNTGAFSDIQKVYDGTSDADATLRASIEKMGISKVLVDSDDIQNTGLVGDDATKITVKFVAVFDGVNVGTGKNITVSGIALSANGGEHSEEIAKSYQLTKTTITIQNCAIEQAPLQVVFTLPTKTYDGTKFVDSVDGDVYYELGGEYGDFKTDDDSRRYRVTFLAAAYTDANAGDVVDGYFIGVELVASSSVVNYYLVDSTGARIEKNFAYGTTDNPDGVSGEIVARYKTSAGRYEYIYSSTGSAKSCAVVAATGVIEKAVYAVTVVGTVEKEFDNTDAFDFTSVSIKVEGLDDASGVTITDAKFESVNVGTWTVTFTLSYAGGENANYTVSETTTAKGTIKARTLTVSIADDANFVYGFGGKDPAYADYLAYTLTIDGTPYAVAVKGGVAYMTEEGYKALAGAGATPPSEQTEIEGVTYYALNGNVGTVTLTSAAFTKVSGKWADVGTYPVTGIEGSADNFVLALEEGASVEIGKATLTVSAKGDYEYVVDTAIADLEAKVLGELVPDGITNGDVFASAVSGIKVSFGDLTVNSAPAKEFAITVNIADATSANYTLAAGANTCYVTVVLPELSVTAKGGQSSIYDGTDRLDDADFLAALVNRKTDGVEKAYTFEVVDEEADFAIKNAGNYAFDIKVTCKYTGLEGYPENNGAYVTTATVSVDYDVNKAALTISRSGKIATIYYTAKAQKLTDYDGFFAFEGAVEAEVEAMLDALATSVTYTSGSATAKTFTNAGAYEVALNATEGVFANYNVTSGVTLLNVRKAPVNVNGTVTEGDIGSDVAFGVTVTGVVRAEGCPVDAATVGKLSTTVKYSSGAAPVDEITEAGVYNYVITLSDPVNYEIVSGGTLGASGTLTVTVKVVTENDSETAEKKAEVVFETPQTRAWTLSSYELAESNSTYIAYSSEAAKLAGTGETVEIGGVVRLELVSGTTTINATTTGKLGETVEITVKLPSALSSGTSGYTIYERQKDGSLKEVSDYVVNDGYFTYNSDLISDLVFVRIVGSGVPFWIWILVAVLAALIILAIILAAFIGRKDRSTTPPPAAPPAEPPVEDAPVSHDGALPAADVDIDIPDAPAHVGGGDRPPLIGTR